jgi:hypothetical protein
MRSASAGASAKRRGIAGRCSSSQETQDTGGETKTQKRDISDAAAAADDDDDSASTFRTPERTPTAPVGQTSVLSSLSDNDDDDENDDSEKDEGKGSETDEERWDKDTDKDKDKDKDKERWVMAVVVRCGEKQVLESVLLAIRERLLRHA